MADTPPLDPSIMGYLQGAYGGALPDGSSGLGQPAAMDFSLPPSVSQAVQSGFSPSSSAPPVALPDQQPTVDFSLPSSVSSAVQNGFAPPAPTPVPSQTTQALSKLAVPSIDDGAPSLGNIAQQPPAEVEMPAMSATTGKPATPAELRAVKAYENSPEGIAQRAEGEQRQGINEERGALHDATAAEVAQNDAKAAAIKTSAERAADQEKVDNAKKAAHQADVDKYTAQYAQQIKDAANFKVDTDRHISNVGLIAIALTGIGNALDHYHGPNAALEILERGIDKRIADQWAQKKALGDTAEQTKNLLGVARSNFDDARQEQQLQRAAERERLANDLQLVAAQTSNPAVKARAEAASAQLTQKSAAITMSEAQRKAQAVKDAQEAADRRAQVAAHYATLDFEKKKWQDQYGLQVAQLQAAGKSQEAAAKADELKQYNEKGIGTIEKAKLDDKGNPVLDPKTGQPQLDSQPFKQKDGETLWVPSGTPEAINKLRDKKSAVDDVAGIMSDVMRMRSGYSSSVNNRDEWQAIQAKWANAKGKYKDVLGLGALSGDDYKLLDSALGSADPTGAFNNEAGIRAARTTMIDGLNHDMKNHLYTGQRYEPPDTSNIVAPTNSAFDSTAEKATSRSFNERHEATLAFAGGGAASLLARASGAPERMASFNQLIAAANGDDTTKRNSALEYITKIANQDGAPEDVKAAANDYLQRQVGLH